MADYRISPILLALAGSIVLGGCSTYDDYGYGGVSLGYGTTSYYGSSPYYGWYDGYYYPGAGYYVYDSNRQRYSWNDRQRRYWEARGDRRQDRRELRENWAEFAAKSNARPSEPTGGMIVRSFGANVGPIGASCAARTAATAATDLAERR
jgi:hypothetical protein